MCTVHDDKPELARLSRLRKSQIKGLLVASSTVRPCATLRASSGSKVSHLSALARPTTPAGRGTGSRARIRRHQRSSVRPKKIGAKRNGDDRSRPGRVLILKRAGAGNEAVASFTEIFAAIGAFILGSGAISAIAFGLFKVLGEKWLNAKFEERLAEYKHAQQKEIEQLRFRINALMDSDYQAPST
jgi:hypothetical protein